MRAKHALVVLLAGLNLFLLALLVVASHSPPAAYAAKGARAGDFLCVTAKPGGQSYEIVYILDHAEQKLHAFYPTSVKAHDYAYGQFRDLEADFGKK